MAQGRKGRGEGDGACRRTSRGRQGRRRGWCRRGSTSAVTRPRPRLSAPIGRTHRRNADRSSRHRGPASSSRASGSPAWGRPIGAFHNEVSRVNRLVAITWGWGGENAQVDVTEDPVLVAATAWFKGRLQLREAGVDVRRAHCRLSLRERKSFRGAKVDNGLLPAKRVV